MDRRAADAGALRARYLQTMFVLLAMLGLWVYVIAYLQKVRSSTTCQCAQGTLLLLMQTLLCLLILVLAFGVALLAGAIKWPSAGFMVLVNLFAFLLLLGFTLATYHFIRKVENADCECARQQQGFVVLKFVNGVMWLLLVLKAIFDVIHIASDMSVRRR